MLLAFGTVLLMAVLVSERANRTVLSTSVVFLAAGFLIGRGGLGWITLAPSDEAIEGFAELALFTILFVDGAQLPLAELTGAWRLPGRALLVGMPLTLGGIAFAGHAMLGMTWSEALLVGAILSPTDPVFVAAILEHENVPLRLRRVLSVESGLNDGLALPIVMVLLAVAGHREAQPVRALLESALGVAIGVLVPAGFLWLEQRRPFAATAAYRPLAGLGVACFLLGMTRWSAMNEFLAAFAAGITLVTLRPTFARAFLGIGVPVAEALKLAALLVLGVVLSVPSLAGTGLPGLAFAGATLLAARPLAIVFAFLGGDLSRREWLAAAWFGPKGFASLLYALLVLHAGLPRGGWLFRVVALVIVLSIVAHSSSDVAVARVFRAKASAVAPDAGVD